MGVARQSLRSIGHCIRVIESNQLLHFVLRIFRGTGCQVSLIFRGTRGDQSHGHDSDRRR